MPRTYLRKTDRAKWDKNDMALAISDVANKVSSLSAAAIKYQLPEPTLRRYYKNQFSSTQTIIQRPLISATPAPLTPSTSLLIIPPKQKRELTPDTPTAKDLLTKAVHYLEMEEDECSTLAKAYATKLRKLTPQQLMFADKVINDILLDAQMGLLSRNTHLIHI